MGIRMRLMLGVMFALLSTVPAGAQAPTGVEVDELIKQHKLKVQDLVKNQSSDRQTLAQSVQSENQTFCHQMISLALQNDNTDAGETACRWVIEHAPADSPDFVKAVAQYKAHYAGSDKIANGCLRFASSGAYSKSTESLLRAILKKNNSTQLQALACVSLASCLQDKSPSESRKFFQRAVDKYGTETFPGQKATIADMTGPRLYEAQHLAKGMPAPDIDATDVDGKPMKLSDFRGKIVMLDFFGDW